MPFRSVKQRKWMFMHKPEIAKRWAEEHGTKVVKPKKKAKRK
jgi:hypothetical protein